MCLARIDANRTTKRVGYKVVKHDAGKYYTGLCGTEIVELPVNQYVRDPNKKPIGGVNFMFDYPAGFHICLSKHDAEAIQEYGGGIVVKVRFRKVTAVGVVNWMFLGGSKLSSKTVVAREVKLVGEDTQTK